MRSTAENFMQSQALYVLLLILALPAPASYAVGDAGKVQGDGGAHSGGGFTRCSEADLSFMSCLSTNYRKQLSEYSPAVSTGAHWDKVAMVAIYGNGEFPALEGRIYWDSIRVLDATLAQWNLKVLPAAKANYWEAIRYRGAHELTPGLLLDRLRDAASTAVFSDQ
jgi:hypothetical protein